jgi:hypothetical protein
MIKFAVGYNRRGIDETVTKTQKNDDNRSTQQALMHREQCFKVVAGAIKSVSEGAIVDLKSPEVSLDKSCNSCYSLARFTVY